MSAALLPDWRALRRVIDRKLGRDYLDAHPEVDEGGWYAGIVRGWGEVGLVDWAAATAWPGAPAAAVWLRLAAREACYWRYREGVNVLDEPVVPAVTMAPDLDSALTVRATSSSSLNLDGFDRDGNLAWDRRLGELPGRQLAADLARRDGPLIVALGSREWRDRAQVGGFTTTDGPVGLVVVMDYASADRAKVLWHELGHRLDDRLHDPAVSMVELEDFADAAAPRLGELQPVTVDHCASAIEAGEAARAGLRDVVVPGWPTWWTSPQWWPQAFGGAR